MLSWRHDRCIDATLEAHSVLSPSRGYIILTITLHGLIIHLLDTFTMISSRVHSLASMYDVGLDPDDGSILTCSEPYALATTNHQKSPLYRRLGITLIPAPASSSGVSKKGSKFWLLELSSTQSLHLTPFELTDVLSFDNGQGKRSNHVTVGATEVSRFTLSTRTDLGPRADRDKKTVLLTEQLHGEYLPKRTLYTH